MNILSVDTLPVAIILWLIVYPADYYLTIYGRRLWLKNAQPFFTFAGSYELNPYYQKDIDAERLVSRRFIFMLAFGVVWMILVWGATHYLNITQVFSAGVGYLVLMEVVVISSHVQNIRLFKMTAVAGAVEGHMRYSRWVSIDATAWKYGYWALVFLVLALLNTNWFLAGGAVSCLSIFIRYRRYSLRVRQAEAAKA